MSSINIEFLWKDRKRHFGLPLSFTRYALSKDRLFMSVGFFNIKDEEVLLYRIRDIALSRTLWQRLLGVGTVTVMSSDKSMPQLVLQNVKNPLGVKELIHESVEEMKIRRKVRVGEFTTSSDSHDCCHHDEDDDDFEAEMEEHTL